MDDSAGFDYSQPHKMVDGEPVLLTSDEITAQAVVDAAWEAGATKRSALEQIRVLENSVTDRRTREAVLGVDGGWLANINQQIAALRSQL